VARTAQDAERPALIPDHTLLQVIGVGAYGEVWLAHNVVGTLRAVKIVRRDRHTSAESFEREFKGLQKFEPVSRTHEGLVDILTLGLLPDGAGFYYVMELADDSNDRGRNRALKPCPSLRTGRAVFPHTALRSVGLWASIGRLCSG
jgi:serine/threonine protein kinase